MKAVPFAKNTMFNSSSVGDINTGVGTAKCEFRFRAGCIILLDIIQSSDLPFSVGDWAVVISQYDKEPIGSKVTRSLYPSWRPQMQVLKGKI